MMGFAANAARTASRTLTSPKEAMEQVLGLHGPDSLPVTYALAQEFGVVDDWFASVPGPTYPNRHFLHCATAKGKTGNSLNVLGQSGVNVFKGLDCETTFSNVRIGH